MKAWNLSSRSDVPPANTPPQKIKTKNHLTNASPFTSSLSLSLSLHRLNQLQQQQRMLQMQTSNSHSFFHNLRSRELNGFRGHLSLSLSVSLHACNYHLTFCTSIIFIFYCWFGSVRKRAHISDVASGINEIGAVAVEHRGEETPPLAISFCKVQIFLVK